MSVTTKIVNKTSTKAQLAPDIDELYNGVKYIYNMDIVSATCTDLGFIIWDTIHFYNLTFF